MTRLGPLPYVVCLVSLAVGMRLDAATTTVVPVEPACLAHHLASGSETCAAWVSAQAAQDALLWSQIQAFAAIGGLFGLLFTLYFALRANQTGQKSSEDQLRAWCKVTPRVTGNLIRSIDGCAIEIEIELENIGTTPAIDVELFAELYSKGDIGLEVSRVSERLIASRGTEYPCTLFTGERVVRSLRLENDAYGVGGHVDSMMLSLIAGAGYRTSFDRPKARPHLTVRVYDLSDSEGGLVQASRPAGPGLLILTTNILHPGAVS